MTDELQRYGQRLSKNRLTRVMIKHCYMYRNKAKPTTIAVDIAK